MNFRDIILHWYQENKRDLPWRETKEPYRIWVSEIILQQTRVEQGLPYYLRFIKQFPNVKSLAEAPEQEVLNVWKGLGYYTRARYMHETARQIIDEYKGNFPLDYDSLIRLKGIGSYTAAAISSISGNEKRAAIDGNVIRVLSRYYGIQDAAGSASLLKKIGWISAQLITDWHPGEYNQAMMEYGAVVCTPSAPKCEMCLLKTTCYAYEKKMTGLLPLKKKTITKRNRYFNYLHILTSQGKIVLKKRSGKDIWKNMWDFPLIESDRLLKAEEIDENQLINITGELKAVLRGTYDTVHVLSHQLLHVRFFTYRIKELYLTDKKDFILIDQYDTSYPLPRLIENFLKRNDIFFGYE